MKMAFKKFSGIAVVALVACMVPMAHAVGAAPSTEDEQYAAPITQDRGEMVFQIDPNFADAFHDNISVLEGEDATGEKFCSSTSSAPCATGNYRFSAVLGPCTSIVTVDCIESVTGASANGTVATGVFKQQFPLRGVTDYTGSPSEGVPSGGTPSLWTLSGLPHGFGNDYEVAVQISGSKVDGDTLNQPRSFSAVITPVSVFQTDCDPQNDGSQCRDKWVADVNDGRTGKNFWSTSHDESQGYLCRSWSEDQKCTLQHAFPVGAKFTVKVRLSTSPSGWLHGRLQEPVASIVRANNVTTVSITAGSVQVPTIVGLGQFAGLPAPVQESYTKTCFQKRCGTARGDDATPEFIANNPMTQRQVIQSPSAFSPEAFEQIKLWTEYVGDKAVAMPSLWSVRTLSDYEMESAPSCIKNGVGVTGIVATNASAYSEGPPSFDKASSTLNYKVAAMHYEKDGVTPFSGRYSLVLRSDIAECLYGVTSTSAEATVSVSGEDGAVKTASSSFKLANGWFTFSATGFSHSAPTIKVKLAQKAVAAPVTTTTVPVTTTTVPVTTTTVPVTTTTVPVTTTTVPAVVNPEVKVGKTTTVTSALRTIGVSIPSGAKVVVTRAASSAKKCSVVQNKTIKGLSKGSCKLAVSITPKSTKTVPRPKTIKKSVTITVK